MAAALPAFAEERFPPPEFSTPYRMPAIATPAARADLFFVLDIVVLIAALFLGSHLVLKKRTRSRTLALMLFSLAYFGFYRKGCVCSIGSIQNVALAVGDPTYGLPLVVALWFALPLLAALFFGRVFCAAVCPMGALQDAVLIRPVKVPAWLDHALGLLPYLYLGGSVLFAATGSAFLICQYDPFVSFFRLSGSNLLLGLGAGMLLLSMFVGRPYCRFLCPYGVLLRWLSPWAKRRVTITPDVCVQCRLCEDGCPFGAIRVPTPEPSTGAHREGRGRLALLLALLPVLVLAGVWVGGRCGRPFSRLDHTVRVADRVWQEERGKVQGTTDESEAFRKQGQPSEELYRQAADRRLRFDRGARWFGAWVGLVFGLKLILLSLRRHRKDYEADPAACLACARCYVACPQEHVRLGLVANAEEYQDALARR